MSVGSPEESDSEYFADTARNPIPPKDTWDELTTNQLIDVKLQLENKLWEFGRNKVISAALEQGIKDITALIASRAF